VQAQLLLSTNQIVVLGKSTWKRLAVLQLISKEQLSSCAAKKLPVSLHCWFSLDQTIWYTELAILTVQRTLPQTLTLIRHDVHWQFRHSTCASSMLMTPDLFPSPLPRIICKRVGYARLKEGADVVSMCYLFQHNYCHVPVRLQDSSCSYSGEEENLHGRMPGCNVSTHQHHL